MDILKPKWLLRDYRIISRVLAFFSEMDIHLKSFLGPVSASAIVVMLRGIGLYLLIPILQGLVQNDFLFLSNRVYIKAARSVLGLSLDTSMSIFIFLSAALLGANLLKNILSFYISIVSQRQIIRFNAKIKKKIFKRVLSFGKFYFDNTSLSRVNLTINSSTDSLTGQLANFQATSNSFFTIVVMTLMMLVISWPLTLATLIVFPLFMFSGSKVVESIRESSRRTQRARDDVDQTLTNIILSLPLVKSLNKESRENERFGKSVDLLAETSINESGVTGLEPYLKDFLTFIAMMMVAGVCFFIFAKTGVPSSVTPYLVFFFILRMTIPQIIDLSDFPKRIARSTAALERLEGLLNEEEKFFIKGGEQVLASFSEKLEFRDLSFSYDSNGTKLDSVNFTVSKGEKVAIVGSTGSGKSTIVSLIPRLYDGYRGSILLDGTDIREFTLDSLRAKISYLHHDPCLFFGTIRENLLYGADSSKAINDKEILACLESVELNLFIKGQPKGLDTVIGDRGVKLSAGEKQRLAIARSILRNADIIIMDEATSAIDNLTERNIRNHLSFIWADKTVIWIAHRLSSIDDVDKIVVMSSGKVVEQGSFQELMKDQNYFKRLWDAQITKEGYHVVENSVNL